jgi:hypothetical protein
VGGRDRLGETQVQYAERVGVKQPAVSLAIKVGRLPVLPDGSIDPATPWPGDPAKASARARRAPVAIDPADVRGHGGPVLVALGGATAHEALADLQPGGRVVGITKGQFGMGDILAECLSRTGPADVLVSAWRVGADAAEQLAADARIKSLRLVIDYGFGKVEPDVAARVIRTFGAESIRLARTHAKFAVVRGGGWNLAIRTSMNLNKNPRFEQFDIDDDATICDLFERFATQVTSGLAPGLGVGWEDVKARLECGLDGKNTGDRLPESEGEAITEHVLVTSAKGAERSRSREVVADGEPDFYVQRARKMRADAEIAELKARAAAGDLVPKVDVERDAYTAALVTRKQVLSTPSKLAARVRACATDADARLLMHRELCVALNVAADAIESGYAPAEVDHA